MILISASKMDNKELLCGPQQGNAVYIIAIYVFMSLIYDVFLNFCTRCCIYMGSIKCETRIKQSLGLRYALGINAAVT